VPNSSLLRINIFTAYHTLVRAFGMTVCANYFTLSKFFKYNAFAGPATSVTQVKFLYPFNMIKLHHVIRVCYTAIGTGVILLRANNFLYALDHCFFVCVRAIYHRLPIFLVMTSRRISLIFYLDVRHRRTLPRSKPRGQAPGPTIYSVPAPARYQGTYTR
jgi:hypothetical protein